MADKPLPSVNDTITKWKARTATSQQAYTNGINNAQDWASAAVAAGPARDAGLQAAIADGRIDRGIQDYGTAKWKAVTAAKGPAAWLNGVNNATAAATAGFQTLFNDINNVRTSLPPRGDIEANIARSAAMSRGMHAAKLART